MTRRRHHSIGHVRLPVHNRTPCRTSRKRSIKFDVGQVKRFMRPWLISSIGAKSDMAPPSRFTLTWAPLQSPESELFPEVLTRIFTFFITTSTTPAMSVWWGPPKPTPPQPLKMAPYLVSLVVFIYVFSLSLFPRPLYLTLKKISSILLHLITF